MATDVGAWKPGQSGTAVFSIPAEDRGTASVTGAGFSLEGFTDNDATATIKFTAGQIAAGPQTGTLTYGPNGATEDLTAEVEHELTASGASAGSSVIGAPVQTVIMVTNWTHENATVAIDGDFTLSHSSVSPSSGPQSVTVTFTPTELGTREGNVTVAAAGLTGAAKVVGVGVETQAEAGATSPEDLESVTTDSSGDTTKTTYKVHVPSSSTKMHLGAAVDPFPHDGFCLRTNAKGLAYASSDIGISSESGDVIIQAKTGKLYGISKDNAVIATGGSAYLLGDGGVTICTAVQVNPPSSPDTIPTPESDLTDGSAWAAGVFAALDGLVALGSLIRVGYTSWKGHKDMTGWDIGMAVVSGGAAAIATTLAGFSVANAAGQSWSVPGVTIYGHAGVLIGTPGFGGMYAAAGLVLGSTFPVMLGMDAELLGLRAANVTGKNVNIQALDDVSISGGDAVKLASATLVNAQVDPTGLSPTAKATMVSDTMTFEIIGAAASYLVRVSASDGVQVGTSDGSGALDTTKPHAKFDQAEVKVAFKDGGSHATITDGTVTVEHADNGSGVYIKDNLVSLYDTAGTHWVKVMNNMIEMKAGSAANAVQLSSSGIAVKGSLIKWG